MDKKEPCKKTMLLEMLEHGMTMLHIDARHNDVDVPEDFKSDYHFRLNLSYRFNLNDLEFSEADVQATLDFNALSYHCRIPYSSIWGLSHTSTEGIRLFSDALPVEVLMQMMGTQMEDKRSEGASVVEGEAEKSEKPKLQLVTNQTDFHKDPVKRKKTATKNHPHLRLVKTKSSDDE